MDTTGQQLIEARRMISILSRVCRQTVVYLNGTSAMDEAKLKRVLNEAVRESDEFLKK